MTVWRHHLSEGTTHSGSSFMVFSTHSFFSVLFKLVHFFSGIHLGYTGPSEIFVGPSEEPSASDVTADTTIGSLAQSGRYIGGPKLNRSVRITGNLQANIRLLCLLDVTDILF